MKVLHVEAQPGYKLQVTFDDGVSGVITLADFVGKGIFTPIKETETFNKVYSTGYSVAWSDEMEIDAVSIYADLTNKTPEEVLSENLIHAAN